MEQELTSALQIFLECPQWREFVHDEDCIDPNGHNDHPEDRVCTCDGPNNIDLIESVAKQAGLSHLVGEIHISQT